MSAGGSASRPALLLSMGLKGSDGVLAPTLRVLDRDRGAIVKERAIHVSHPPTDFDQAGCPHLGDDGVLWQPTRNALHRVDPSTLEATEVVSHPLFHDNHSAPPGLTPDSLLVTSTGIETVLEVGKDGSTREVWRLGPQYDLDTDFRDEPNDIFKPHDQHPNQAFVLDGKRWATCLYQHACKGLDHDGRWDLGPGKPHDGIVRGDWVWFTTTDGGVIAIDPATGKREVDIAVAELEGASGVFGWARGLDVRGDRLWLGVSVIRSSKWKELAREMLRGAKGRREPTRVIEVDWRNKKVIDSWLVGDSAGEGVIYGVTALS